MTKRFGFTLAEVLITLAIIGVVAALTMPSLINNTQGAQFKTAFKKAMSIMSQAVVMNIALDDYDLSGTNSSGGDDDTTLYALFTNRMNLTDVSDSNEVNSTNYAPYLTYSSEGTVTSTADSISASNYVFYTNDGMLITFPNNIGECTETDVTSDEACLGYVDVNGTKGPNKVAACEQDEDGCTSKVTINDIYPFIMYDQTIAPSTGAGRAIMFGRENIETE